MSRCSLGRFQPGAQHFRYTPRLRYAAAGQVGLARVEDFADRANAVVAQMDRESFKKFARSRAIVRMQFEPRVNKWANEPGPNRALVICAVA